MLVEVCALRRLIVSVSEIRDGSADPASAVFSRSAWQMSAHKYLTGEAALVRLLRLNL